MRTGLAASEGCRATAHKPERRVIGQSHEDVAAFATYRQASVPRREEIGKAQQKAMTRPILGPTRLILIGVAYFLMKFWNAHFRRSFMLSQQWVSKCNEKRTKQAG
ncbi:hypothetical protein [Mesorhizobium sp. M7A.F.Ca.US.011.01.1.1]|uniref:hypothetical protein n=1 Tax=Mesorhizobium sp. M7A.F.Ca.US.011.01.1.1 TaxID=2496741 RepID=UPI0013E360CA|nr:hypothetical protein [Mesorhizobium sp. M7A.F.Ca.US.011.01.1.1]